MGFGVNPTAESVMNTPAAAQALAGSNRDVVANRAAIRMANMSAAEMLKAELAGAQPLKPSASLPAKPSFPADITMTSAQDDFPGLDGQDHVEEVKQAADQSAVGDDSPDAKGEISAEHEMDTTMADQANVSPNEVNTFLAGVKRKIEEVDDDIVGDGLGTEEEEAPDDATTTTATKALKVNADGTVEQEDTVKCVQTHQYLHCSLTRLQVMGTRLPRALLPSEVWR